MLPAVLFLLELYSSSFGGMWYLKLFATVVVTVTVVLVVVVGSVVEGAVVVAAMVVVVALAVVAVVFDVVL